MNGDQFLASGLRDQTPMSVYKPIRRDSVKGGRLYHHRTMPASQLRDEVSRLRAVWRSRLTIRIAA